MSKTKEVDVDTRRADMQMAEAGSILDGVPRHEDVARLLLSSVKTVDDLVKILHDNPRHQRSILLAAQKVLGNQIVTEAVTKLDSPDHMLGADLLEMSTYKKPFREALSSAGPEGGEMSDAHAPAPAELLAWTSKTEWDAVTINRRLGQMDLIAGTDSDNMRCSFATALAMAIFDGPANTVAFLTRFLTNHAPKGKPTDKQRGAMNVIALGIKAIQSGKASYGDMAWLQEALHDLVLAGDQQGTTARAQKDGFGRDVGNYYMSEDFNHKNIEQGFGIEMKAEGILKRASALQAGERLVLVWLANDGAGTNFEHQLMIANHGGKLFLYDSGQKDDGNHLMPLTKGALGHYFENDSYLEVLTKIDAVAAS